jgi:hypothetical protein
LTVRSYSRAALSLALFPFFVFSYTFFWFSIYCFTTASGAPPTVDKKYEFVQSAGNLLLNVVV